MVTAASARIYSKLRMHERHIDWKCAYCEFRNVPHPRTILFFMWHHDDGGKGNAHRITIFQKISLFLSARCGGHVHTLVSFLHFVDDLLPLMCVFFCRRVSHRASIWYQDFFLVFSLTFAAAAPPQRFFRWVKNIFEWKIEIFIHLCAA